MGTASLDRQAKLPPPVAAALAQLRAGAVDVASARLAELAAQDVLAGRRAQARATQLPALQTSAVPQAPNRASRAKKERVEIGPVM